MKPYTERQTKLIVNNIVKACESIDKLNAGGYGYLMNCSGFIAHYNHAGFVEHYRKHSLTADILQNARNNRYLNFREGDQNFEYYRSKADIYKLICESL